MRVIRCVLIAGALLGLGAVSALAGATPQQKCQASKNQEAGKFLSCRLKAEAKLVTSGNTDRYNDALGKCFAKLEKKWNSIELKATEEGVDCPTEGDLTSIDAYLSAFTLTVAEATTSGGGVPTCGDAELNAAGEQCDGADLGDATCVSLGFASGSLACAPGCVFDTSACNAGGICGDGDVNDTGEECDGADLNGRTCASLGFFDGTLACGSGCTYDTSACNLGGTCGDGDVNDFEEECDGADLNGRSCTSLGFFSGTLGCDGSCDYDTSACDVDGVCGDGALNATGEQCDGSDLGSATCTSLGYVSGTLACGIGCGFDTSGCTADGVCNDGSVNADGEECDGGDLNGRSCASLGFASGTLTCNSSCDYDTSGCDPDGFCGDGAANAVGEECDGGDLNGRSCLSLGFADGTLTCDSSCDFDTSGCPPVPDDCGNGTIESPEECDQNNLNGATCASEGFADGDLTCSTACVLDTSGCWNDRFVDNGDGTITDRLHRLMWEKKVQGVNTLANVGEPHDSDNTYRFSGQCSLLLSKRCQPDAQSSALCFAETIGDTTGCEVCDEGAGEGTCNASTVDSLWRWLYDLNDAAFAGFSDWRLPTPDELYSLVDFVDAAQPFTFEVFQGSGCGAPCTDSALPSCSCTRNNDYWTGTTVVTNELNAWAVGMSIALPSSRGKTSFEAVRAVRDLD